MKHFIIYIIAALFCAPLYAQNDIAKADAERCQAYFRDSVQMRMDVIACNHVYEILKGLDMYGVSLNKSDHFSPDELSLAQYDAGHWHESYPSICMQDMYDRLHIEYDEAADRERMKRLIRKFRSECESSLPSFYRTIDRKFKGNVDAYVDHIFENSLMGNERLLQNFKKKPSRKTLQNDPALQYTMSVLQYLKTYEQQSNEPTFLDAKRPQQ